MSVIHMATAIIINEVLISVPCDKILTFIGTCGHLWGTRDTWLSATNGHTPQQQ